ncbi:OmpA family protein [Catellatospora sp. NPDC049609]|uniref:OmpA family protein n=1 Tax=Catellatospora sp. NPDC049609 TaxID=3155505 RepID=UPI0034161422
MAVIALLAGGGGYLYLDRDAAVVDSSDCPKAPGPVTFALGARANMPAPTLPDTLSDLVAAAVDAERPVVVYRVDGQPSVAIREHFTTTIKAPAARKAAVDAFTDELLTAIAGIRSRQDEADPLEALHKAARDTPRGGTVVLFDSGLQTAAPLDFRAEGMLAADPDDVVAALGEDAIPDLTGRRLILMGLGDTAAPQDQLSPAVRANVTDIWQAVAAAGGAACVQTLPDPPERDRTLTDVKPVSEIAVPKEKPLVLCGEVRLTDGGDVGFHPRTADLRDPAAARKILKGYAEEFLGMPGEPKMEIVGTTARWSTRADQEDMSRRRADVVRDILVSFGVLAGSITTKGVGSYSDYYRDDNGPEGPLEPAAAAFNRSVIIRTICQKNG